MERLILLATLVAVLPILAASPASDSGASPANAASLIARYKEE